MNQTTKRTAEIPGKIRIFCLSMALALAGLTGCGRRELEFYTQEELAEASGTAAQEEDAAETEERDNNAAETDSQDKNAAEADSQPQASSEAQSGAETVQTEKEDSSANAQETAEESGTTAAESAKIYVDVCGAVASPGVYELEADSRVFQAIELAGGYLPEAAQNYLNRAGFLTDGQQIYVPTQAEVDENPEKFGGGTAASVSGGTSASVSGETAGTASGGEASGETAGTASGGEASVQTGETASDSGKVNLNTADISELTSLPGIGESKAQAIIAYREANGGFQTVEELMKVDGIKEGTYAKLKDQITVG